MTEIYTHVNHESGRTNQDIQSERKEKPMQNHGVRNLDQERVNDRDNPQSEVFKPDGKDHAPENQQ